MKKVEMALMLLLAVAVVVLSVMMSGMVDKINSEPSLEQSEQIVLDAIMTRSSVRSYTDQVVEQSKVEMILKAGMAAPTGGNKQPWSMVVITEREILDAIPPIVKGASMAAKAQLAIAVCGTPSEAFLPEYWVQDCSAMTENILLAAHAMGLGAVWCGVYPENGTGRVDAISSLLSLPKGVLPLSIIVIGYPDSEPSVKDKWNPSKVHYNQYHVPYEPVEVKKKEKVEKPAPAPKKELKVVSSAELARDVIGYEGQTPVELYIDGETIVEVRILPNSETPEYMDIIYMENLDRRWNGMSVSQAAEAAVDGATGATFTSNAIIENVRRAAKSVSK